MPFNIVIPVAQSKIIKDKIVEILNSELANQYLITGEELYNFTVTSESSVPYDQLNGIPSCTVSLSGEVPEQSNPEFQRLTGTFHIYINHSALQIEGDAASADQVANEELRRLGHVIRYILQAQETYIFAKTAQEHKVSDVQFQPVYKAETSQSENIALITLTATYKEQTHEAPTFDIAGVDAEINDDIKSKIYG